MSNYVANADFLKQWHESPSEDALLPNEVHLIHEQLSGLQDRMDYLIEEKRQVSGGDDWHDGAFRATDNEADQVATRQKLLHRALNWQIVEMPDSDIQVATLGSRVTVRQNSNFTYLLDIVGLSIVHEHGDDDELIVSSLSSPLGKVVMGKAVGANFQAQLGPSIQTIEILDTQPNPDLLAE
jgi:transcription elongation GreA/GreB family factor